MVQSLRVQSSKFKSFNLGNLNSKSLKVNWGIHLTGLGTICSVYLYGGLSAEFVGIREAVCHRRGMSGVPL
jgi:hypothetical protein